MHAQKLCVIVLGYTNVAVVPSIYLVAQFMMTVHKQSTTYTGQAVPRSHRASVGCSEKLGDDEVIVTVGYVERFACLTKQF